jgi:hypothetical protein
LCTSQQLNQSFIVTKRLRDIAQPPNSIVALTDDLELDDGDSVLDNNYTHHRAALIPPRSPNLHQHQIPRLESELPCSDIAIQQTFDAHNQAHLQAERIRELEKKQKTIAIDD